MVRKLSSGFLILATLVLAAGMICVKLAQVGVFRSHETGRQDAGAALEMPVSGEPDLRLHFLSAWQAARIPRAARFDPPLGSEQGALVYNAQKFFEMNDSRGGHHTGDDLNGIGGANTDLGDPVFAVADGLVVFAGEPSPDWGKVVVIAHLAPDGTPMQSMVAHLDRIDAKQDALVWRGEKIGTVGTAGGRYPAHLHFEMLASDGIDLGAGYALAPLNRLDPAATIEKFRNSPADGWCPPMRFKHR